VKLLLVGDPHIRLQDIQSGEAQRLADWIFKVSCDNNAICVFLGDQFNDHGVIRVEVLKFWMEFYRKLSRSISIVGNHDMNADCSASAIEVFSDHTDVVSKFTDIGYGIDAAPFFRNHEDLYKALAKTRQLLICHAEFNGAQYENGYYSPHGADLSKVRSDIKVLSGHIHKSQILGNVRYVGTPRMLTRSDIGETKGINLLDTTDFTLEFIPTPEEVCEPFKMIEVTENDQNSIRNIVNSSRCFVDIKGSDDFIKRISKKIPEKAQVRTFKETTKKEIQIKESDGIGKALYKYINEVHDFGDQTTKQKALEAVSGASGILGQK
jgi:DNA repair exonuclease SbcCD nuclease subunit